MNLAVIWSATLGGGVAWVDKVLGVLAAGLLVGASALADAPTPAAAPSTLDAMAQGNPFDPERKPWPDVVPPPPPIPVPAAVTEADLQVYGVVVAGPVRKAILKLGPRFAGVPVGANGFAQVAQGGQLGEFTLAEVQPDQVLLRAVGGQQWVRFGIKKDRSARGAAPVALSAQPQFTPVMAAAPTTPGVPMVGQAPAAPGFSTGGPSANAAPTPSPPAAGAAVPGSLGAAIAAAMAAQNTSSGTASAPAPMANPFEALLKQQQQR